MKMFLSRLSNTRSHSDNNYVTRWNGVYFRSRTTSHVVDVRISRGKSKTSLIVLWFIINRRRINGIDIDSAWWIIEWINRPFESRWPVGGRLKAGRIANATGSRETPIVKDLTLNQQPASFEKKLLWKPTGDFSNFVWLDQRDVSWNRPSFF